jgi:DNA-binding NarL/FixJ family response regulator
VYCGNLEPTNLGLNLIFAIFEFYLAFMWSVAIIDDDLIILEIIKQKLYLTNQVQVVHPFSTVKGFLEQHEMVDFLFLDIKMEPINGLQAIPIILEKFPDLPIIILSSNEDEEILFESLRLGAIGYLLKSTISVEKLNVFDTILKGGSIMTPSIAQKVIASFKIESSGLSQLTQREKNVVEGILEGLSYKMIADKFAISIDTVRMNIKSIYKKLNINSKAELFKVCGN